MEKAIKVFSIVIIMMINVIIGLGIYELVKADDGLILEQINPISEEGDLIGTVDEGIPSESSISFKKKEPFAILLLGVDTDNLKGRSDTIIVAVVNPKTADVNLLSIPRDTRVKVNGSWDKITHAHAKGLDTAIETVENTLDIPVSYYVKVNFNGFIELVDALGGVEIDVPKDIDFNDRIRNQDFHLDAGRQRLDGYQALNYARFRGDAQGDFGRNDRQKEVIRAIIDQSISFRNLTSILDILNILGENVDTNLNKREMLTLLVSMKGINGENVKNIHMDARPEYIAPVSYVTVEDSEWERIQNLLDGLLEGKALEELQPTE